MAVSKMPQEPWMWGLTVPQLRDLGAEVFGSPEETFDMMLEIMMFGLGTYQNPPVECEPDGFGGWKYNDMKEMPEKAKMNLYDVVTKITKPKTKGSGMSYSVFVNSDAPKETDIFISHAWAEKFAYLVGMLCFETFGPEFFKNQDTDCAGDELVAWQKGARVQAAKWLGLANAPISANAVLWICAFCIDQNADIQGELGGSVEESPFAQVLRRPMTKRVVVLYNPAIDLYTRIWCCYEIFLAVKKTDEDQEFSFQTVGIPNRKLKGDYEEHLGERLSDFRNELGYSDASEEEKAAKMDETAKPWADEFTTKFPLDVKEANASVEADKTMILEALGETLPTVNETVNTMRRDMFVRMLPMFMEG